MQLRFASFAVINSREDLHLQECARAGRTKENGPEGPLSGSQITQPSGRSARGVDQKL